MIATNTKGIRFFIFDCFGFNLIEVFAELFKLYD